MPNLAIEESMLPTDLRSLVQPVPVMEGKIFQVPVAMGRLMQQLAIALHQSMNQLSVRELLISEQDVVEFFRYVLAARCAYVSGLCKSDLHPKDVEYPTLLFPVLAGIGRWVDPTTNVEIIPIPEIGYQDVIMRFSDPKDLPDPQDPSAEGEKFTVNKGKRFQKPESYEQVLQTFRALGVSTAIGLPMDKHLEDDGIYRLEESDDAILGGVKEPSVHQVYTRALVEMSYLAHLYGEARVIYVAVQAMKSCVYELVARHVRGPSRRLSG